MMQNHSFVDGVKKGEGETFNVGFESGTKNVTVNGGFFRKIISFFKNLFGMNRTVVQAIFKGVY